jgi:hypothetical protein
MFVKTVGGAAVLTTHQVLVGTLLVRKHQPSPIYRSMVYTRYRTHTIGAKVSGSTGSVCHPFCTSQPEGETRSYQLVICTRLGMQLLLCLLSYSATNLTCMAWQLTLYDATAQPLLFSLR